MAIEQINQIRFRVSCCLILGHKKEQYSVGTLNEKSLHAVLKHYLVPIPEYHEVQCAGYIADILWNGHIFEIQTANFNKLRKKLDAFLSSYDVTIVYPIPAKKWVIWIDQTTGKCSQKRKSPKIGNYYEVFPELYRIKMYLKHPHLHLRLILVDVEEFRIVNNRNRDRKQAYSRFDRIPVDIYDECILNFPPDYRKFIPKGLPDPFTSKDFQQAINLSIGETRIILNILTSLDAVVRVGKSGNHILYVRQKI